MKPRQLLITGQVDDPGINIASIYGLTSVTVNMNLSLPANLPCGGNFFPVNRAPKLS